MANQYSGKYTEELILEILDFYKNNSNSQTCKQFHMKLNTLRKILKENNIDEHTYGENCHLSKLKLYGSETYVNIEKAKETRKIKKDSGWKYPLDKRKESILKKYGSYENYLKHRKSSREKSIIKKYGSFEEYYNLINLKNKNKIEEIGREKFYNEREKKTVETNKIKYGVEHFAQSLDFHKKKKSLYKYYDNKFDSLPELALWVYAKDHDKEIERNPCKFIYYYNNKKHYYVPDFKYDGELIEIKGDHFFKEDGTMCNPFDHSQDKLYELKHQCGLKNGVKFWGYSNYKPMLDYLNLKIERKEINLNDFKIN